MLLSHICPACNPAVFLLGTWTTTAVIIRYLVIVSLPVVETQLTCTGVQFSLAPLKGTLGKNVGYG